MQRALDGDRRVSELKLIVGQGGRRTHLLKQAADFIQRSGEFRWVGLYDVNHTLGEVWNLVSSASGIPAYPIFPLDKGLTGVSIRESRTIDIGDVAADPHYLTAFGATRSEIIVPIFDHLRNAVIGTIDVESEKLHAFPDREQVFLEDCAEILADIWTTANGR
jgi:L-methionine (R)-S-oxide reductase